MSRGLRRGAVHLATPRTPTEPSGSGPEFLHEPHSTRSQLFCIDRHCAYLSHILSFWVLLINYICFLLHLFSFFCFFHLFLFYFSITGDTHIICISARCTTLFYPGDEHRGCTPQLPEPLAPLYPLNSLLLGCFV